MKLLLLSNSTNVGEPYLGWTKTYIVDFLTCYKVTDVLFVPYAGVNLSDESLEKSYDIYEEKVRTVFNELGFGLRSVHRYSNPNEAVIQAKCIVVGGGNTFHLVSEMHRTGIMHSIRAKVLEGTPFIGWSAGSNVACPTLRTTNDMPIIQPASFDCLNLIPFQINPHYLDANPAGHGGETRQQRIEEFLAVNRDVVVVGLRETSLIEVDENSAWLKGERKLRLFKYGEQVQEIEQGANLGFLLKKA